MRKSDDIVAPNEKQMHAAVCAQHQDMPSLPHAPSHSVKVTTLQTLSPPYVRHFLHRLPFLLRLLLMPLGYFHPITFQSITCAWSGKWLASLLQQKIFRHYPLQDAQIRRLERKVMAWLVDASFCLLLTDVNGLGQVPLNPSFDIATYLHFADIMAFRTADVSGTIQEIIRLGGADATFTVPSFLLPHHEHLLPRKPTAADKAQQKDVIADADGTPNTVQAEKQLEKLEADETEVGMSFHDILPAALDQSLLNFVAALVKATKVIEMGQSLDEEDHDDEKTLDPVASLPATTEISNASSTYTSASPATVKNLARRIRQNLKDGRAGDSMKEFARDLKQSTKDSLKKAVVGSMVNDRWIAKLVGKISAKLEAAQGDVGYSGALPVALAPYCQAAESYSELLP